MNIIKAVALPDIFSLCNALFGFLAVMAAFSGWISLSIGLLVLSLLADGADGYLARRMGSGPLGQNLDSFADLISFGAAPALLALSAFDLPPMAWAAGGLYLICGTLRLARFNITPKNERFFEGLPIPAAGIMVAASIPVMRSELTLVFLLILSFLMVTSFPFPKVRDLRLALLLSLTVLLAALILWSGDRTGYAAVLFIATLIYLSGPVVIKYLQKEK